MQFNAVVLVMQLVSGKREITVDICFSFSLTALLVGENLPPEAEIDVSDLFEFEFIIINKIMCV